jgi:hypothetical protein
VRLVGFDGPVKVLILCRLGMNESTNCGDCVKKRKDATGLSGGVSRSLLRKEPANFFWMPRACPVEVHVCCYRIAHVLCFAEGAGGYLENIQPAFRKTASGAFGEKNQAG